MQFVFNFLDCLWVSELAIGILGSSSFELQSASSGLIV